VLKAISDSRTVEKEIMRTVTCIGLTAVAAAALTAFVGAGTASATVLCKTDVSPCPAEWMVSTGTEMSATLDESAKLKTVSGEELWTCTGGSVSGPTEQTGSSAETVSIKLPKENMTWSGCTHTTTTVAGGTLEFHWIAGSRKIAVTVKEAQWTVLLGVSCTYGYGSEYKDIGTIDPPEGSRTNATVTISTVVPKTAGSFACPVEVRWIAAYAVTGPNSGTLWAMES
jgi:hypothetical protein